MKKRTTHTPCQLSCGDCIGYTVRELRDESQERVRRESGAAPATVRKNQNRNPTSRVCARACARVCVWCVCMCVCCQEEVSAPGGSGCVCGRGAQRRELPGSLSSERSSTLVTHFAPLGVDGDGTAAKLGDGEGHHCGGEGHHDRHTRQSHTCRGAPAEIALVLCCGACGMGRGGGSQQRQQRQQHQK